MLRLQGGGPVFSIEVGRFTVSKSGPHTVTAYVSPNTSKALAILGNSSNTFVAIVDMAGLLSAPRTGHVVNNPLPAGLVTFVAL